MSANNRRRGNKNQQQDGQQANRPNPTSVALFNIMFPQPGTSTSAAPTPSTSRSDENISKQNDQWQSYNDLDADERLARQLAEEEEVQYALSMAKRDTTTKQQSPAESTMQQVDLKADERLARQLAQQEEDLYFSTNQHTFTRQQQNSLLSKKSKSKQPIERREYNPINFSNVVIHTKTSKKLAKQLSKKQQFSHLSTNNDIDTSDTISILRRLKSSEPEPRYPHVYDALLDAKLTLASLNNQKVYLPITSARKSCADYEEITVKKMDKTDLVPKEKLISVADNLEPIGRVAFSGCTHLNPMQSIVFETAYKTNKNMLVAAPTGAGKTNVAMLTVLNELRNHFKQGTTEMLSPNISEKFKIIYIAPMKSLATEQTDNFSTRLKSIGIKTRELTGDMSMTEREIAQTHIIVTTPEKWDVVTRKPKGDVDLLSLVRLLIIDEVHLLQSDRGPVLEALVARTLRFVESSQRMTRIIGLSATLPNYIDVATFLRVNPYDGLFYFDNRFRPVPLTQTFIGVRPLDSNSQSRSMDKICYNLVLQHVMQSKQVMIFVHARNSTQRVAGKLREMIQLNNKLELFQPDLAAFPEAAKLMSTPKNKLLGDLFNIGFGIHHAGMIRQDRLLVEKLFRTGVLKVLVCTATLAWGVNFPAHAVIIRGTEIYDASVGKFVDVGLLDVMQIFGRAGRPQYDTDGHAIILTALEKMDGYLKLLTNQTPIESNFIKHLTDNLNAEIVSGTVSSIQEGMEWLRYTYLNVRLAQNPLVYGYDYYEIESDPSLATIRHRLIVTATRQLDEARMCRHNQQTGDLEATDLGRIASHFYINYETISKYNEIMTDQMLPQDILGLIGEAQEFQQIKYREEESNELENLRRACYLPIAGGAIETTKGKVSCLLQAYISRSYIETHSLISDLMYIAQNATRIGRGLFEYSLKRGWSITALNLLKVCKMLELQAWEFQTPFRHFDLPAQVIMRLEEAKVSVEQLDEMSVTEVSKLVNFPDRMGIQIKEYLKQLPYVIIEGEVKPIKSNLLTLNLTVQPYFKWNDRWHGRIRQSFWLWVVDDEVTNQICHSEHIRLSKEQVQKEQTQKFSINIPLVDATLEDGSLGQRVPSEYLVYVIADQWTGCDYEFPIDCRKVTIPNEQIAFTKIPTNLNQLSLNVLQNELYATLFQASEHQVTSTSANDTTTNQHQHQQQTLNAGLPLHVEAFNILQSQVFHPIYHCERSLLICGPTGSGKTALADLALLRQFNNGNKRKVVYITPVDSLAQLKYRDWVGRFGPTLGKKVIILNDYTLFDENLFDQTDVLVSSAEKFYIWMCKSSSEHNLQRIALFVFDDLHLISDRRGSSMEVIIAKLNRFKITNSKFKSRYIGIANTVANAHDLANWLGIKKLGAYNFHPATARPIQLEIHVISFPERHYSPRMATMNKPIFKAITTHSAAEPVLVFVSSKKQCSLTALDLISCLAQQSQLNEKQWLHIGQSALNSLLNGIQEENLKLSLEFGIGFLYPSMKFSDKKIVQELYLYNKIQVLICTTNYAWESNLRARLVIVKGTEHYDSGSERFVDYQPLDVMQMLGKAGRPNMDSTGVAILMIRDIYKEFYKKFLYEPFPVESDLLNTDQDVLKNFLLADLPVSSPPAKLEEPLPPPTEATSNSEQYGSQVTKDKIDTESNGKEKANDEADKKNRKISNNRLKKIILDQQLEAKKHAISKFSSTFLARRLNKNPSYYGLNDGKPASEFLSRFLDDAKYLYET